MTSQEEKKDGFVGYILPDSNSYKFRSIGQVKRAIRRAVRFYNSKRPHMSIV